MNALLATAALAVATEACAEQAPSLPRPMADYAVRGLTVPEGGEIAIHHSGGRLRIAVSAMGDQSLVTGLLDLGSHRMTLLSGFPGMDGMAVEIDLPARYRFLDMPADSVFVGADTVATEPCGIWRVGPKAAAAEVCLTDDGIPLRVRGTPNGQTVAFEVTELERVPQDPGLFALPPGLRVKRIPQAMQKLIPGLGM